MDEMKPCPKCGETLKKKHGNIQCRNGCEIYTATPTGHLFNTPSGVVTGQDGKAVSYGGYGGNFRTEPTCKE